LIILQKKPTPTFGIDIDSEDDHRAVNDTGQQREAIKAMFDSGRTPNKDLN
jgi:hypothetical protein